MNEWNCDGCHFKMDAKELEELEKKLEAITEIVNDYDKWEYLGEVERIMKVLDGSYFVHKGVEES